jgi:competence protein ComEA
VTVAHKAAILVVLAMIGAAGVSVLATSRKVSPPAAVVERAPAGDVPGVVTVHVAGLVSRPGVYQLPTGARVLDALTAAGGVTPEGDAAALNLASVLADGQRVEVLAPPPSPPPAPLAPPLDAPVKASTTVSVAAPPPGQLPVRAPVARIPKPRPAPTTAPATGLPSGAPPPPGISGGPVSLSRATIEELQRIPRVGPERAKRIIYYRWEHGGFRTVNELDQVPGFGPKLVEDVRPYVVP